MDSVLAILLDVKIIVMLKTLASDKYKYKLPTNLLEFCVLQWPDLTQYPVCNTEQK